MFSKLIVGTMRWGIWGANFSIPETQNFIDASLEDGLTTFDCADIYGNYTTEELFGKAFSEMSVERDSVQIISKCGIEMPCDNRNYKVKAYNYSKHHILNSVDNSLKNLHTDYLDVLLLHRPSPLMNPEEIIECFEILKSQGKVNEFGVSNFSVSQFDLIDQHFPLITNQIEVSINETKAFNDGTLEQLMMKKLSPMAWSPMGNYFSEKTEQNLRIKKVVEKLCEKYGCEEDQILLAFILKHPSKILPVIGTSSIKHLKNAAASLKINLEHDDWFLLLEASRGKEVD
ncbi:aldo/keto reductase [Halpernia frigidisoli]|uniref:Predicted oxidoreductase n=1 Tax=Halpernia frigidisoli TaxID=1125876 RepID=A0A1I3E2F7_9FLAO|nr:aldo/keto reductase [Halpernia frigidisoli]SFH93167.1 Predicted oxidoreductase [Halpernia frigidisoli]